MEGTITDTIPGSMQSDIYSVLEINAQEFGICEAPRVLSVLSSLLERVVARNEKAAMTVNQSSGFHRLTVFHGLRAPSISIKKYLERIFKYANCSPSCFVVAYIYIERLMHRQPGFPITALNVHRLLITSVMVAAKFLDDVYYNNAYYAKVGGVTTIEMNRLELEFLFRLGFRLHVTVNIFESYCAHLEREVAFCAGYQIEKALKFTCGLNGNSIQDSSQNPGVAVSCNYAVL